MLGGGGDDVIIIPVVYPSGMVIVQSHNYLSSVGYYSKPSHSSFTLSIYNCHIQKYLKNKRERKGKLINPHQKNAIREERRNQMRVSV